MRGKLLQAVGLDAHWRPSSPDASPGSNDPTAAPAGRQPGQRQRRPPVALQCDSPSGQQAAEVGPTVGTNGGRKKAAAAGSAAVGAAKRLRPSSTGGQGIPQAAGAEPPCALDGAQAQPAGSALTSHAVPPPPVVVVVVAGGDAQMHGWPGTSAGGSGACGAAPFTSPFALAAERQSWQPSPQLSPGMLSRQQSQLVQASQDSMSLVMQHSMAGSEVSGPAAPAPAGSIGPTSEQVEQAAMAALSALGCLPINAQAHVLSVQQLPRAASMPAPQTGPQQWQAAATDPQERTGAAAAAAAAAVAATAAPGWQPGPDHPLATVGSLPAVGWGSLPSKLASPAHPYPILWGQHGTAGTEAMAVAEAEAEVEALWGGGSSMQPAWPCAPAFAAARGPQLQAAQPAEPAPAVHRLSRISTAPASLGRSPPSAPPLQPPPAVRFASVPAFDAAAAAAAAPSTAAMSPFAQQAMASGAPATTSSSPRVPAQMQSHWQGLPPAAPAARVPGLPRAASLPVTTLLGPAHSPAPVQDEQLQPVPAAPAPAAPAPAPVPVPAAPVPPPLEAGGMMGLMSVGQAGQDRLPSIFGPEDDSLRQLYQAWWLESHDYT